MEEHEPSLVSNTLGGPWPPLSFKSRLVLGQTVASKTSDKCVDAVYRQLLKNSLRNRTKPRKYSEP